jgi:hypothetical protein
VLKRRLAAVLLLGLSAGIVSGCAAPGSQAAAPTFNTPFQAVLLTTGQVYYGRIEGLGTPFPILRNVYYVQGATDPQTQQVTNVLIRRGKEWHGPEFTVLNAEHIALIEPVAANSKVAELIAEQEKAAP